LTSHGFRFPCGRRFLTYVTSSIAFAILRCIQFASGAQVTTLDCRPREGGDPYAVFWRYGLIGEMSEGRWLWVPAFARTATRGPISPRARRARARRSAAACVPPARPAPRPARR